MSRDKIRQYKGEVVDLFSDIEFLINSIISHHYLNKVSKNFLLEVLYDPNFSFSLRMNILEKVLKNMGKLDEYRKNVKQQLHEANTIRNTFAHCGLELFPAGKTKGIFPDPKNLEKELDFETMYGEFKKKHVKICEFLWQIIKEAGVKVSKQPL